VFAGLSIMVPCVQCVSRWLIFKCALLLSALLLLGVQVSGQQKAPASQANQRIQELAGLATARAADTPIGSGDLIHVEVFDVPELSRDLRVSETGDITFPLVPGKIPANGLTSDQLEQNLAKLLIENGLVSHPQVSVFVKEQNSQPVSLVGAVQRPMVYQIIRPTTLLELLAQAGGVTDEAGSVVIVTRNGHPIGDRNGAAGPVDATGLDTQTITIRLQDLLESGNPVYNIQIYGGDAVSVPRAGIVYVMGGGVIQPGGYVLQSHGEQLTVLKAVALAHGLTWFAKADQAVIMRNNTDTGQKDMIPVHIKQIQNQKTDDVTMKSNDVLYVPDSKGLKVLAKGSEAALQVGTGVAIYRY
jgi:polysaccharide biosynthesis/export protein